MTTPLRFHHGNRYRIIGETMTTPTPRTDALFVPSVHDGAPTRKLSHGELQVEFAKIERDLAAAQADRDGYLKKLLHAEALLAGCSAYLKDGEVPVERIQREIADCAAITRLYAAALRDLAAAQEWKEAVLNELIVAHIYTKEHDTNPRKAIQDAITWNCQVALDPAVSSDARKLIAAAQEAMKAAEERAERNARALDNIENALRKAGATLPAPEVTGTIEGSMNTGLCIALCLVVTEREAIAAGDGK